jgi:hypothetical protein
MQDIDWKIYRHPKFLQSLNLTSDEGKYLNLFLKRSKFENIETIVNMRKTRVVTASKGLNSSKFIAQEKVGIDI